MRTVVKGDTDAQRLVTRFRKRAIEIEWNPEDPFDPGTRYDLPIEPSWPDPIFVILLPDGSCAPDNDVITWYRDITYGNGRQRGQALFVDVVPCHRDWFGLKVVNEVGFIELEYFVEGVIRLRSETYGCNKDYFRKMSLPLTLPLIQNHHAMVSRLIDRRMRGRIADRVKILKSRMDPAKDIDLAKKTLFREILNLLPLEWPEAVSGDEQLVREGLINSAATCNIARLIGSSLPPD